MNQDDLKARFILRDDGVFVNRYSGEGRAGRMIAGRQAFVKLQQLRIELHGEFACDEENK